MPIDLTILLDHLLPWLLVLARFTGVFILSPILGGTLVFRQVRVLFCVAFTFAVYPMVIEAPTATGFHWGDLVGSAIDFWKVAPIMVVELGIGFVIGYLATLPMLAMQMAGQMVDTQMGLAAAGVFDPEMGDQRGVTAQFMYYLAAMTFLVLDGHIVMLDILLKSFTHVPPSVSWRVDHALMLVLNTFDIVFTFVVRIGFPMLALFLLEMIAMAFIARTVPQMNLFSIGFVVKIIGGLLMVVAALPLMTEAYLSMAGPVMNDILEYVRFGTGHMDPGDVMRFEESMRILQEGGSR